MKKSPKHSERWEPYGEEKRKIGFWIKFGAGVLTAFAGMAAFNTLVPEIPLLDDVTKFVILGGFVMFMYLAWEMRARLGRLVRSWAGALLPVFGYDVSSGTILTMTIRQAEKDLKQLTKAINKLGGSELKLKGLIQNLTEKSKTINIPHRQVVDVAQRYNETRKLRTSLENQREQLNTKVEALKVRLQTSETVIEATREANEALKGLTLSGNSVLSDYEMDAAENSLVYELTVSMAEVEQTISDIGSGNLDAALEKNATRKGNISEISDLLSSEFNITPDFWEQESDDAYNRRTRDRE